MHIRPHIAITALAAPVFLAACALEAYAQDTYSAASPETETFAGPDCPEHHPSASELPPQKELARDIRTIVTGVKSPVQQEALAQAARIPPGQMSDALREVLVDAAAFVNYFYFARRKTPDARLDSLSRLLACALQPHFSQDELAADILSINSYDEQGRRLQGNQARQETAAWLTMHIAPGEMGEELKNAVIDGVLSIGGEFYSMYVTWEFLSEALLKQYAGYSDADLAAEIRTIRAEGENPDALLVTVHAAVRWDSPGFGSISDPENIGPESRAAVIETLAWLNERANERAWLQERRAVAGDEEAEKALETGYYRHTWDRVHRMLAETVFHLAGNTGTPEIIEMLAASNQLSLNYLGVFGSRGVVPIINVLSGKHVHTRLAGACLHNLAGLVQESLSSDDRALLVNTAHRFLEREGLKDFRGLAGTRQVLDGAIGLALALDEPDLMQIVETLASSREEAIARGIPVAEAEYVREDVQRQKRWKAESEAWNARLEAEDAYLPQSEPETAPFSQDELVAAIQAITEGETGDRQQEAVRHVERMAKTDPAQIGDTLRAAVVEAFFAMSNEPEKPGWDDMEYESYYGLLNTLESATISVGDAETVKLFVELDAYDWKCVGTASAYLFSKFPDRSIPLIAESISQPGKPSEKTPAALYILADMVIDYKRGWLDISQDNRNMLIATTRRFLEEDIALSWATRGKLNSYSDSNVLSAAIELAIALDDPDLIDILQELATNPEKITVLGLSDERGELFQESIKRSLSWRPYMGPSDC